MTINYKKELETAAKSMILVHEPDVLIKMIARTIVHRIKVSHAAILLHEKDKSTYVLDISKGQVGVKIPAGFARMDTDNPLIQFFLTGKGKKIFNDGPFLHDKAREILNSNSDDAIKELLKGALQQMDIYESVVCVPSYFRDELLALLLLGKKSDGSVFGQEELDFFMALASDVAMAIRNAQLFRELENELDKKKRLFFNTAVAFAAAIEAKDHYTHGHTNRVTALGLEITKKMAHQNKTYAEPVFMENLHVACLLHDIGKIGVPESILNKIEPLTQDEWIKIKEHPMIGVNILQSIKELEEVILGVKYHHERYDGSGYPEGLKGDQIPIIASIISVADAFDAMTTNRVYRAAKSREVAINEIQQLRGRQFHPLITDVFITLCQEGVI
ncbi:MAG: HD domain-containing protein [Candidatus Omnitrophota bacterium]|nr:MAG: HD domain-containing protein [Candidatus Omnitrophota bacterium]